MIFFQTHFKLTTVENILKIKSKILNQYTQRTQSPTKNVKKIIVFQKGIFKNVI